ncbi:MAG: protease SohB [Gammaproteobacteria bacterium]|nr:protease SohB [Gammaproteobacteria bacterium]
MSLLNEYGLFLAKTLTLVLLLIATAGAALLLVRQRGGATTRLRIRHLNDKYEAMILSLQASMLSKKSYRQVLRQSRAREARRVAEASQRRRVFVLEFHGDLRASAVASLREEINAVLGVVRPGDEVMLLIESHGGAVHGYGLAASQLARIRSRGIPLTVAVDKIAASGGYMMACVGDRILAAPFAIVGSIGVVAQLPNFNRLLKKHDIDFELHTAGEFKRTLTLFGENTDAGRGHFREEIEDAHRLFKDFVRSHRPALDIEAVATGEWWFGTRALELGLVDELRTSDDYLLTATVDADVYAVTWQRPRGLLERLIRPARDTLSRLR